MARIGGALWLIFGVVSCSGGPLWGRVANQGLAQAWDPSESWQSGSAVAVAPRVWRVTDAGRFAGLALADEPQAAMAGQRVLASGGNAADGAAAVYFALAVTYPGAAGLGGGGSCLIDKPGAEGVQQIDFPVAPAKSGGAVGVPGNIKGFSVLQSRYGRLGLAQALAPALRLARGHGVMTKATHAQVKANRSLRWLPEGMKSVDGLVPVGRSYAQPALATTLTLLAKSGEKVFYNGVPGETFAREARVSDGEISAEDLRSYAVSERRAVRRDAGQYHVFTRTGSAMENSVWKSALDGTKPISADMNSLRSGDAGSTSFVVADAQGGAVACVVSMNGAFGIGDVSQATGIYLSSAQDATSLSNMVVVKAPGRGLIYAGASGGGASGLQKSAATLAEVVLMDIASLGEALSHNVNSGFDPVNALSCDKGLAHAPTRCHFGTEPTSHGYGLMAEEGR